MLSDLILTKSFPAAIRRVREHRALGHRTVLITGALDFVVEPLAPLFDDIVSRRACRSTPTAATPARCSTCRPPARAGRRRCSTTPTPTTRPGRGGRLRRLVASDLPMLEVVGFPVAVNPETRLASLARKRGWLVEHWEKAPGGSRPAAAARRPPRRRREGARREGAPLRAQAGPVRGRRGRRPGRARARAPRSARCAGRRRPARAARRRLGAAPAPAGRHLRQRPGHHRRPLAAATSSPSSSSRSRPATRSSATSTTAPGPCSSRAVLRHPGRRPARARPAPPARINHCERIAFGHLDPGLQTGFCADTGGGWSTAAGRPPEPAAPRARRP